jgi:type IV secretory pathway TraG/TraD family ATPase VirD4
MLNRPSNSFIIITESTQISEEGQPLVLPQDIGSLSPDDVIIIVQ